MRIGNKLEIHHYRTGADLSSGTRGFLVLPGSPTQAQPSETVQRQPSASPDRSEYATHPHCGQPPRTRLVFGNNSVDKIANCAREVAARNILLVTDSGIAAAGHVDRVRQQLRAGGLQVTVFDQVEENPSAPCVEACAAAARSAGVDTLIGLGGGSSLDAAKGCNVLLSTEECMDTVQGVKKAPRLLPFIAIPTTAGTGGECRPHAKEVCNAPWTAARIAILDPTLTISQPTRVTACTGIDVIAHAVETATSRKASAVSLMHSKKALRLTANNLPKVLKEPGNLEAREKLLLGAAFAGLAIEQSMLGAAHATASPLSANYGILHGQAVGIMLPHVVRFNSTDPQVLKTYAELASGAGIASATEGIHEALKHFILHLESLLDFAGTPFSLEEFGVERDSIPALAEEASHEWIAAFNPRPATAEDFVELYESAWIPRRSRSR